MAADEGGERGVVETREGRIGVVDAELSDVYLPEESIMWEAIFGVPVRYSEVCSQEQWKLRLLEFHLLPLLIHKSCGKNFCNLPRASLRKVLREAQKPDNPRNDSKFAYFACPRIKTSITN